MAEETRDLVIRIEAQNLTSAEFNKAKKSLDDLGKQAGFAKGGVSDFGEGFQKAA